VSLCVFRAPLQCQEIKGSIASETARVNDQAALIIGLQAQQRIDK
jgi:hypothetical protein